MSRLASGLWVSAYLQRLALENIPAYVLRRGDATAGAVLVKLSLLDGTARAYQRSFDPMTGARQWMVLADGAEPDIDATLKKQAAFDPDLWIVELESRDGRTLLDEPGLAD